MNFSRKCPMCDDELLYSTKVEKNRAKKSNSVCLSCSHIGKKHKDETKKKMSLKLLGNKYTLGYKHTEITKEKLRKKTISDETKEKLRKRRWEQIEKLGVKNANFNPKACEFIDNLNKERGWNLQHALNGGEVKISWYSVDGYDKERNIVFEYDERSHNSFRYKQKDLVRQKRIVEKVNPSLFIRYDEDTNTLYEVKKDNCHA
jgi:hypothetical protein